MMKAVVEWMLMVFEIVDEVVEETASFHWQAGSVADLVSQRMCSEVYRLLGRHHSCLG